MSQRSLCLVCGCSDDEVPRMHSFTSNLGRSRVWRENMGIKFTGDTLKNYKICCRHFTPESYAGTRLRRDATPTLFPAVGDVDINVRFGLDSGAGHEGELEQRSIATATFVSQVDELFDSFNGTQIVPGEKQLKSAISETSEHVNYWTKAMDMVKNWHFKRITKTGQIRSGRPPSQIGWMTSIRAIKMIWAYVHSKGVSHLKPRYLNQDGLENMFGLIRQGCGSGDNPTAFQFIGSLKTQILNGLTGGKLVGSNCEADEHNLLSNLTSFIQGAEEDLGVAPLESSVPAPPEPFQQDLVQACLGTTAILSVAYVGDFLMKHIFKKVSCELCHDVLSSDPTEVHNAFISYKEWSEDTTKLLYPSERLVVFVGNAVTILETFLNSWGGKSGVSQAAANYLQAALDSSWFICTAHHETVIKDIIIGVCAIGIPWWTKRKNREIVTIKKDARATKRKLGIMQHGKQQ